MRFSNGLASRQVFENGNKRTAWLVANIFSEVNGADIGLIPTIQSDAFVRAVSVDHTFEEQSAAEWFEVALEMAQGRRSLSVFPDRVTLPVLFLANNAIVTDEALLDVVGGGWSLYRTPVPGVVNGVLCAVIEVPAAMQGRRQALSYLVRTQSGEELEFRASSLVSTDRTDAPVRSVVRVPFSFVVAEHEPVTFEVEHERVVVASLGLLIVPPL